MGSKWWKGGENKGEFAALRHCCTTLVCFSWLVWVVTTN